MKNTGKNEIDLLLRNMAKRGQESSVESERESRQPVSHLDADELNAYAEQALPAATRARYTAHLADCSSCRKIVSDLAMSSGIVTRERPIAEVTGTTFGEKLRALLSPQAVRYGIPALALLALVTFSIVLLRPPTKRDAELVAQNSKPEILTDESNKPAAPAPQEDTPAKPNQGTAGEKAPATVNAEKKPAATANGEVSETTSRSVSELPAPSVAPQSNAAKTDTNADAVAQSAYAPEPPPPAKAQAAANDARKNEESEREKKLAKEKDQAAVVSGVSNGVASNSRSRDEVSEAQAARTKSRAAAAAGRGGGLVGGIEARRAPAADAKRSDEDKDVHSVEIAGRRFRKQGNAWIDTAYDSSRSTTNVARNSEQYRALVADEPGIRTIADQLQGEVILVWKGRAYRIK